MSGRWRIDDVLAATDLAALLDEVTEPAPWLGPGRRWHCPLPDHDDPYSCVTTFRDFDIGREIWRCWSGPHDGDAIDVAMVATGHDRDDAIEWLAARAGIIPDRPVPPAGAKSSLLVSPRAVEVSPLIERYARVCETVFRSPHGREVRDWLAARGFNDDTIEANTIGADPGRRLLRRSPGLPYGAGPAAVFPVLDPTGRLVYVQAPYLDEDAFGRKYDQPASALALHPRLAFPVATGEDRVGTVVVCHGLPDALTAAQAGFRSVAVLGAQTQTDAIAAPIANHAANHRLGVAVVSGLDRPGRRVSDALVDVLLRTEVDWAGDILPQFGYDLNDWAVEQPEWGDDVDHRLPIDPPGVDLDGVEL